MQAGHSSGVLALCSVSVPVHGREKRRRRCRSGRVGSVFWGGVRGAFANHSLFLPTTQRCDGPPVRAGVTRTFPGMDGGGGGVRTDLRSAARAKVWGRGFTAIGAEAAFQFANAIWSFIESRNRPAVGRSAAPERPGRPGSGPTVQHGHWGSQIRFNDEAIRLSEARQAATRAARASKWLDLF